MSIITRTASRALLKLNKHSPTLLFGAGIIGLTGTIVLACRATLQGQDLYENHKNELDLLNEDTIEGTAEHRHAVVDIYRTTAFEYVRLYGPAFVLGVTSVAALTKSHQILSSRNVALTAAYTGLDRAFKAYRQRVVDEFGLEKDTELVTGTVDREVIIYDEKGNHQIEHIKKPNPDAKSLYGRWFDDGNRYWEKDHGYNRNFLDNNQKYANLQLASRGHFLLNDVYDMLGFDRTKEGAIVGWVYKDSTGDGYIDFGFHRYPDFVAGYERTVFLDFNVDGIIYDKI